jgi:hypothetical protein
MEGGYGSDASTEAMVTRPRGSSPSSTDGDIDGGDRYVKVKRLNISHYRGLC